MVHPPIHPFQSLSPIGIVDDLPDHFEEIRKFVGATTSNTNLLLGIKDGDSVKIIRHDTDITNTQLRSVHEQDDTTSYQNTSGKDAFIILRLQARGAGLNPRDFKIYSSPNDNSKTSATEVYDWNPVSAGAGFDASGDSWTTPPLKIQNNHYCVVENNAGGSTSDIDVSRESRVVERV